MPRGMASAALLSSFLRVTPSQGHDLPGPRRRRPRGRRRAAGMGIRRRVDRSDNTRFPILCRCLAVVLFRPPLLHQLFFRPSIMEYGVTPLIRSMFPQVRLSNAISIAKRDTKSAGRKGDSFHPAPYCIDRMLRCCSVFFFPPLASQGTAAFSGRSSA